MQGIRVLGIDDPWIWGAYVLCLAATALCVVYAVAARYRGKAEPTPQDRTWAEHEKKVEDEL